MGWAGQSKTKPFTLLFKTAHFPFPITILTKNFKISSSPTKQPSSSTSFSPYLEKITMSNNSKLVLVALGLVVLLQAVWPAMCADGVDKDGYTCHGNGKCYMVVLDKVNKKTAMEKCKALGGGGLVSIHNEAENDYILGLIAKANPEKSHDFWIGLVLHRHSGDAAIIGANWVDGSPLDYGSPLKLPAGTKPYCQGEPNNHKDAEEQCTTIRNDATMQNCWNDVPCEADNNAVEPFGYVCQKPGVSKLR